MSNQPLEDQSPGKALWVAAQEGRDADVSRLLAAKVAPSITHNGRGLLYIAALNGHVGVAQILLAAGADVNQRESFRISGAAPLEAAAVDGHTAVLRVLLEAKANVSSSRPLDVAAGYGHVAAVRCLLEAKVGAGAFCQFGSAALSAAATSGSVDVIRCLLGMKVNVDSAERYTPLMHAAERGRVEAVKLLLQQKASLNGLAVGDTPLFCAVNRVFSPFRESGFKDYVTVITCLLRAKADPTFSRGSSPTPLKLVEQAQQTDEAKIVRGLLQRASILRGGASPDAAAGGGAAAAPAPRR